MYACTPAGQGRLRSIVSERQVFLIALAFRSLWASKHLPPDPRSRNDIVWQRQFMFMLAAQVVAPHLNLEISDPNSDLHRIWREARIVEDSGPVPLTADECEFMHMAVLNMETRLKLHRARRNESTCCVPGGDLGAEQ